MIQIITDSTSGIREDEAKALGITVLPINIDFDNEIFYDGINISADVFRARLIASGGAPATLPPNALEYIDRFEAAKKNEDPLLVITLSSGLSAIYNSAKLYRDEVDYLNIEIIDSGTAGAGLRILVMEAIKHRETMTLAEITEYLNKFKLHIRTYATGDNLDMLQKTDRIIGSSSLPKCVLNIKPIITIQNGNIVYVDKKAGTKNAQDYIINAIKSTPLATDQPIIIQFARDKTKTEYPKEKLEQLFSTKTVEVSELPYLLGAFLDENATVFTYVIK